MKKFIFKTSILFLLVSISCLPVLYFNIVIDPYGIFRTKFLEQKIEPNQHFIKIKFLTNNTIKKDSFIFGSSRVGKIKIKDNPKLKNYYNMTYSEGVPKEHLDDIKTLLNNGLNIKNIIIGLDNISYLISPDLHTSQALRMAYTPNNYLEIVSAYIKYSLLKPSIEIYREINKQRDFKVFYDIYNTGVPEVIGKDEWIEKNTIAHINAKKFEIPAWETYYNPRIETTIKEISEIKDICQKNNISLIFFINPMHKVTYHRQNFNDWFTFLSKLSEITDFYNFSGINKITTNNYYYYETSHYRPIVGDMIIKRIFMYKIDCD